MSFVWIITGYEAWYRSHINNNKTCWKSFIWWWKNTRKNPFSADGEKLFYRALVSIIYKKSSPVCVCHMLKGIYISRLVFFFYKIAHFSKGGVLRSYSVGSTFHYCLKILLLVIAGENIFLPLQFLPTTIILSALATCVI